MNINSNKKTDGQYLKTEPMIKNFEELTQELTQEEKKLVPLLVKGFSLHPKSDPIKEPAIIKSINDQKETLGLKKKLTGVRLRKLVSFIRRNGILPIMASSKGYYHSYNTDEIKSQIKSLEDRAKGIQAAADGLKRFV